jgi:hypothetical protein
MPARKCNDFYKKIFHAPCRRAREAPPRKGNVVMKTKRDAEINLLPGEYAEIKRRFTLLLRLAAAAAAVLALTHAGTAVLDAMLEDAQRRADALEAQLADEKYAASDAYAEARRARAEREALRNIIEEEIGVSRFDVGRMALVDETLPEGARLLYADIGEEVAQFAVLAPDLRLADAHIAALLETGLAAEARLTAAERVDGTQTRYTLSVRWRDE